MAIDINIPIEDSVTDGSLNPVTSNAVFDALALKANSADLATVATSGDYNDLSNLPSIPSGTVTSVGLTMPSAFTVANSPITSSGDIAVTGAGVASQYVRGDGSLANFPTSSGGGASVSYYLNGSVSQGTFGGVAMREINKVPIIGAGTDFTISSNGYIQSFITDANDPNQLEIPAGNWNFETYFSASSSGGNPSFYIELYKWNGATLTLIASNSTNPEIITGGTATDLYLSALAVPQTTLALTDRLAIRIYVTTSGRTIKLHTENNHLSQIITTFSTGLTSLNGITAQVQNLATGTSGSDFAINSTGSTHTFNLPTASAANRGALSSADWTTFNSKQAALVSGTNIKTVNGNSLLGSGDLVISGGGGAIEVGTTAVTSGTVGRVFFQGTGDVVQQSGSLFWDNTNSRLGVGATPATTVRLDVRAQGALSTDIAFRVRNSADTDNLFESSGNGLVKFRTGSERIEVNTSASDYKISLFKFNVEMAKISTYSSYIAANSAGQFFGIGNNSPSHLLDVNKSEAQNYILTRFGNDFNDLLQSDVTLKFTTRYTGGGAGGNPLAYLTVGNNGGVGVNNNCKSYFKFLLNKGNTLAERASITSQSNFLLQSPIEDTNDVGVIYIPNGTAPTANLSGGGKLYVEGGELKYRGSSGTVTVLGVA
jgi:hypothetical protein